MHFNFLGFGIWDNVRQHVTAGVSHVLLPLRFGTPPQICLREGDLPLQLLPGIQALQDMNRYYTCYVTWHESSMMQMKYDAKQRQMETPRLAVHFSLTASKVDWKSSTKSKNSKWPNDAAGT